MIENMEPQHFTAGQVIFKEGNEAGSVYLIDKGKVQISKAHQYGGSPVILDTLGWNEIFGEMALLDKSVRSATALALEDTWVYMLKPDVFESELDLLHPFMRAIFRTLITVTRDNTEQQVQKISKL